MRAYLLGPVLLALTGVLAVPVSAAPEAPSASTPDAIASAAGDDIATIGVGGQLPSGDQCADLVTPAGETHPGNAVYNQTRGTTANTRSDWWGFARVDGDFVGTTDEIIQWAACKWGIDPDWARAQIWTESNWQQTILGDFTTWADACAPTFPLGNYPPQYVGDWNHTGECPESIGLGQVRWLYHTAAFDDLNAIASSAYNVDYTYGVWRACYEGAYGWLNDFERGATYAAGDGIGCLGVWFSGRWYTDAANMYIGAVTNHHTTRPWPTATPTTTPPTTPPSTTPPTTTPPTTTPPSTTPPPTTEAPEPGDRARLTPITPRRVVDTRTGLGGSRRLDAGGVVRVRVAGTAGIPTSATAVNATITAVRPDRQGFLAAYPCTAQPTDTATVNYAGGEVVANSTIATLSRRGELCVSTKSPTDVVIDITGWLGPDGEAAYEPVEPTRIVDTRSGLGGSARLDAGDIARFDVTSLAGSDPTAVALNVTAVRPSTNGFVTVYPCGTQRPITSTVNFAAGDVRANNLIVGSTRGAVCVYAHSATDLVVDLVGAFGDEGMEYVPTTPVRLLDTRRTTPMGSHSTRFYDVRASALGPDRPGAASVNFAAVGHTGRGYVTAYDCAGVPGTSTLNKMVGHVTANGAIVPLSNGATSCAWTSSAGHLVVDLNGWWVP